MQTVRQARRTGPLPVAKKRRTAVDDAGGITQATCTTTTGKVDYALGTTTPATAINWVTKGFVTPVKDQFGCSSCTAFATTVMTEWVLMNRTAAGPISFKGIVQAQNYFTKNNAILSETDLMECERENALVGRFVDALSIIICPAQVVS
jgi:C1A family cysteine protease